MTQTTTLSAERRTATGKGAARSARRAGKVPAVIYGHRREPEALTVSATDLEQILRKIAGGSTVIELDVEGKTVRTLIRELQRHPTRWSVTHVDFYEIHAGEVITVKVPLRLVGSPDGVRNSGGVLEQFLREINIQVLPKDIPEQIELDATDLSVGASLHVSDLEIPNAKILDDATATICTVVPPRVEEEPVVASEVEEEEEAAEPELVRKPKEETEEAEAGES